VNVFVFVWVCVCVYVCVCAYLTHNAIQYNNNSHAVLCVCMLYVLCMVCVF